MPFRLQWLMCDAMCDMLCSKTSVLPVSMSIEGPIGLQVPDGHVLRWCIFCLALGSGFRALCVGLVMCECVALIIQDALHH